MASMAPYPTPLDDEPASKKAELELIPDVESQQEEQPAAARHHPGHDVIARLAYGFWENRQGQSGGSPEEDWLRAERELRGQLDSGS